MMGVSSKHLYYKPRDVQNLQETRNKIGVGILQELIWSKNLRNYSQRQTEIYDKKSGNYFDYHEDGKARRDVMVRRRLE